MKAPRVLALLLLGVVAARADEADRQVDWIGDWAEAMKLAKDTDRPVMVCINSKDGEKASDATAKEIYHDPEFVALSRKFVMVVVSVEHHWPKDACPRFGKVTCAQHLACWKELAGKYGEQLATAFAQGEMVSPQHAWIKPDGTLLRRKEYWLTKSELMERMRKVLDEMAGKGEAAPGEGEGEAPVTPSPADAPLDEKDRSELARVETADQEGRRAAIGNLLATEKLAAQAALVALAKETKTVAVRCDIWRGLGRARVLSARVESEEGLKDKDELVRSFAAVALEDLGQAESVEPLLKRAKVERDTTARKNMLRALGACGGPHADKEAAKYLLKALASDKQNALKKHAALALRPYGTTPEATALVLKKLEQEAGKSKDRWVRAGVVYTLAFIGNTDTTLPVFEKLLKEMNEDYGRNYMREAINVLKKQATDFGRAAWFLFAEDREDPARQ